jgi:HK97 gp10 family phage protein
MSDEWVTVEVKGLSELQAKLEELPKKVADKGLRKALKAGGNVIRNAMVMLAPKDTGFLAEHFGTKIRILHTYLGGSAFIGPQGKVDYPAYASGAYNIKRKGGKIRKVGRVAVATVARFFEFGTSKMGKKPFMTQAFESHKQEALDAIAEELRDALFKS